MNTLGYDMPVVGWSTWWCLTQTLASGCTVSTWSRRENEPLVVHRTALCDPSL